VVLVKEVNGPNDEADLDWLLLSSLPIKNESDVLRPRLGNLPPEPNNLWVINRRPRILESISRVDNKERKLKKRVPSFCLFPSASHPLPLLFIRSSVYEREGTHGFVHYCVSMIVTDGLVNGAVLTICEIRLIRGYHFFSLLFFCSQVRRTCEGTKLNTHTIPLSPSPINTRTFNIPHNPSLCVLGGLFKSTRHLRKSVCIRIHLTDPYSKLCIHIKRKSNPFWPVQPVFICVPLQLRRNQIPLRPRITTFPENWYKFPSITFLPKSQPYHSKEILVRCPFFLPSSCPLIWEMF